MVLMIPVRVDADAVPKTTPFFRIGFQGSALLHRKPVQHPHHRRHRPIRPRCARSRRPQQRRRLRNRAREPGGERVRIRVAVCCVGSTSLSWHTCRVSNRHTRTVGEAVGVAATVVNVVAGMAVHRHWLPGRPNPRSPQIGTAPQCLTHPIAQLGVVPCPCAVLARSDRQPGSPGPTRSRRAQPSSSGRMAAASSSGPPHRASLRRTGRPSLTTFRTALRTADGEPLSFISSPSMCIAGVYVPRLPPRPPRAQHPGRTPWSLLGWATRC